jgi:hypothetical protein
MLRAIQRKERVILPKGLYVLSTVPCPTLRNKSGRNKVGRHDLAHQWELKVVSGINLELSLHHRSRC